MSKQMTVAIAGLGSRGRDTYAKVAKLCSDKMKIVAIADIDPEKVRLTAGEYGIPVEQHLKVPSLFKARICAHKASALARRACNALAFYLT